MHNGKLHLAIPPGHVDARGLTCPADVIIPACINCGTTERSHGAKGRCNRCYLYWHAKGVERPADLPQRGGIHQEGSHRGS